MGDLRVTRPCPAQDYTRPAILAIAGALFCAVATSAAAFMDETRLLDLRAGTSLSERVRAYQSRGYELSDGTPVIFGDWYRSEWPDVQALFLTPLDDDLGFIWGFGTGEKGGQYSIDPSLHLGFVLVRDIGETETLSLSVTGILGGRLSERPCTADYGSIGGIVSVNCRLAASAMRPADRPQLSV